ncbi:MAG: LysM peptidoglycan-binding domain-containing protein [Gammaproteobacteria bacterium]|nr:LysM peptidoglycan-binding domain-containing protein [Gammaproteobacteria bacterium]NNF50541.1 LysM peptidoglycan-binding domain-containing protein [Woeseiaceae bacterium]MBT8093340.1 LysM peptidoglycan-binding domain-containing protein [Gammaproteobacteria bacterium]MBT8104405.1 LysM peptidoglycan-binding domain-containing protein [Gammaproteobacteria bacterium]NNK24421.1 LysM peptidoglycan-binding domain-containing protein [Woeseiaceae bacterium]
MSLSKLSLKPSLRLTAVSLVLTLAGCGGNPPAYDSAATPASSGSTYEPTQRTYTPPAPYRPAVERVGDPVPLASGAPNEYVVQVGDTLWDIAGTFLRDPWYWPEIWHINTQIENPHLIYPGDVLGLVYIDGQPRITNVRASTYRLSPQARVTPLSESITSIPYEDVAAFLSSGVVLEKAQADSLPYLVATRGDHLIASAGNDVYVRGLPNATPGARYSVVKVGDPLYDPDDNRLIGYQGITVGEGALRRNGDPATVALTDTNQEATAGDRFLPEEVDIPLNFFPRTPSGNIEGRIVSVVGGVTQIGQYMVVVLNRGTNNGVSVGDVLSVWQAGQEIDDNVRGGKVVLPEEQAGTVMVFKAYDRISYGLVMEATQAIHVHDAVRNPT